MYFGELENGVAVEDDLASDLFPQNGEFQKLQSVIVDGGHRFGVSAVAFDQNEELIWMGNTGGHVTSYYGNSLEKYTSFQVHVAQEIRQILTTPEVLLILSPSQLKGQIRRGLSVFKHTSDNMQEMQCMLQVSPTNILMGGLAGKLIDFDIPTSTERKTVHLRDSGCAILRNIKHFICSGEPSGQIHLLDPRSLRKEHTIEAHSGSLSDFDVHGNMMVTCGFSARHGNLSVDRFVKVYDVRNLRAMAPIQVSVDPILLRFLDTSFSARIATVSPSGQMELLETQAVSQTNISLYQVTCNASVCLSFDISTTCHQMVFGDSTGSIHLFSSNPSATFNAFSRDTEFPDPVEPLPPISFTDELASFATVPLSLTSTPYLSDLPPEMCQPVYRTICPIDPLILQSVKMVGTIGYARNPNPGTFRRNQSRYSTYDGKGSVSNNSSSVASSPASVKNLSFSSSSPQPSRNGISGSSSPSLGNNNKRSHFPRQQSPQHPHYHSGHHPPSHLPPGPPPPFFYQQHPPQHMGPNGPVRPYFHNKTGPPYYKGHFYQGRRPPVHHFSRYQIPKRYSRYEWKKNYFEETDMEPFNKTQFCGLEANQANCYCNSNLQILYHIRFLRNSLISHLCTKENCMSCELGFLFHMLNKQSKVPCVAGNFLRAFRLVPEASALALILAENQAKQRGTYLRLIQNFNRFILHQIQSETAVQDISQDIYKDPITLLFEIKQENVNRCVRCGREEKKESIVYLSNLLYSPDSTGGGKRCRFIELLERSLCPEQTTPAWCETCGKFSSTFQSRFPKALPSLISLNTCLDNAHDFQTWRNYMESSLPDKSPKSEPPEYMRHVAVSPGTGPPQQHIKSCRYGKSCMRPDCKFWHEGRSVKIEHVKLTEFEVNPDTQVKWIPLEIRVNIDVQHKRVLCRELDIESNEPELNEEDIKNGSTADYVLNAVVCFVRDPDAEEKCNLISLIRIDDAKDQNGEPSNSNWFLFNDFCVREASATEAVSFNPKWKIPCVLYYGRKESCMPKETQAIPPICPPITKEVFTIGNTIAGREGIRNQATPYKPLDIDEIPKAGDLVAMDAEFVTLGQEETELRVDGKLQTVKPQMVTVARVTCIRGQGPLEGTPFLDDYISTQESQVVDYLTKFSGINPGDLDANFSSKNLAILKSVYLKIRYLIDSGVKFVGHGLSNDFRVINLVVPPEQIIDTVNLFFLPNQRLISLRFLAWHFLDIVIQSEVHDSIEDARTALQLYRKYEELKKSGKLEKELEHLYEVGKKIQWKIPTSHCSEMKALVNTDT